MKRNGPGLGEEELEPLVPSGAIWGSGGVIVTRIIATCSQNSAPAARLFRVRMLSDSQTGYSCLLSELSSSSGF
jgi:hypothetical protein